MLFKMSQSQSKQRLLFAYYLLLFLIPHCFFLHMGFSDGPLFSGGLLFYKQINNRKREMMKKQKAKSNRIDLWYHKYLTPKEYYDCFLLTAHWSLLFFMKKSPGRNPELSEALAQRENNKIFIKIFWCLRRNNLNDKSFLNEFFYELLQWWNVFKAKK